MMEKLHDFKRVAHLTELIEVEKAYPHSILDGYQQGEVFVDDPIDPKTALYWHKCGFADLVGECSDETIKQVIELIHDPLPGHSGRMALHINNKPRISSLLLKDPGITEGGRYIFEFTDPEKASMKEGDLKAVPIGESNYSLLKGRIIPSFSWDSKEEFLSKGFGMCIVKEGLPVSCAFSSAISDTMVDIGVETVDGYRGQGLGRMAAAAMVREILSRGLIPEWSCDVKNENSKRLACAVGFTITGIHQWYKLKS